jgi:hypothetical protein
VHPLPSRAFYCFSLDTEPCSGLRWLSLAVFREEKTVDLKQRELARHALGFPNKNNVSYRNHFCTGEGSPDYRHWLAMVDAGEAVKRTGPYWGGDDMFYLTLKGGLAAREPKEHLSAEETASMRKLEASK